MSVAMALCLLTVGALAAGQWKQFSSDQGKFSVYLPGEPKEQSQTVSTPVGPLTLHMYLVEQGVGTAYVAAYADYDEKLVQLTSKETLLDGARDGQVKSVRGKLVSEKRIFLSGHPGRELKIQVTDKLYLRSRLYLVENRLYQVLVVTHKGAIDGPDANRVLGSFKLTGR